MDKTEVIIFIENHSVLHKWFDVDLRLGGKTLKMEEMNGYFSGLSVDTHTHTHT